MSYQYTPVSGGAEIYVQEDEPEETPDPSPDGDGGFWYPVFTEWTDEFTDSGWAFETGSRTTDAAVEGNTALVANNDGEVYAIDAESGNELWTFSGKSDTDSINAIDAESGIVVTADHLATDTIWGLDITDGSIIWEEDSGARINSISITDGVAVTCVGSNTPSVTARDITTGNVEFSFEPGYEPSGADMHGSKVVVGERDNAPVVEAFETDGTNIWTFDDIPTDASRVASRGVGYNGEYVVFAIEDIDDVHHEAFGLDKNGEELWNDSELDDFPKGLDFQDQNAAIAALDSDGLRLYEPQSGNIRFMWRDFDGPQNTRSVAVGSDKLVIGSDDGDVKVLNVTTQIAGYEAAYLSDGTNWVPRA